METVSEQPIKKIEFFRCPQSLPGVAPLTKKPEDSGYEIDSSLNQRLLLKPLVNGTVVSGYKISYQFILACLPSLKGSPYFGTNTSILW